MERSQPDIIECDFCGDEFGGRELLKKHISSYHPSLYSQIIGDGQVQANYIEDLELNVEIQMEEQRACSICLKIFPTKKQVGEHKRGSHGEPESCGICGKVCNSRKNLLKHMYIHEEPRHRCDLCGLPFKYKRTLQRHMQIVHGEEEPRGPVICAICTKTFSTFSVLNKHTKLSHGPQPHLSNPTVKPKQICHECAVGFTRKSNFNAHMRKVHPGRGIQKEDGEGALECGMCDARFGTQKELTKHRLEVHRGEKAFPCSECTKKFKLPGSVHKHKSTCHRNLEFQCQGVEGGSFGCGKIFTKKDSLRTHLKTCGMKREKPLEELGVRQKARRVARLLENLWEMSVLPDI